MCGISLGTVASIKPMRDNHRTKSRKKGIDVLTLFRKQLLLLSLHYKFQNEQTIAGGV
jgi:hypothetical protein